MAATYLTIGSKFKPYSFEEYVKPLNMYKEEYQRQEDLYNTYAETAGLIGADLNPELDNDILTNTYNPYMQALSSGAEALATEGLTPGGRRQLQELRRRFGREITPIKVASEARTKARENWDKLLAKDKTLMTNANPYYQGISAYMNGASPDTTYVSGNELYSRGQNLAEAFSKTMREVPEDERLALQGQYFRIVNQYGANSAEADAFMQGAIDSIPALAKQVDGILANSGIDAEGFTPADKERARQYIIEGMKAGLSGETKVQYLQNRQWDLARKNNRTDTPEPKQRITADFVPRGPLNTQTNKDRRILNKTLEEVDRYVPLTYNNETYYVSPELAAEYKEYQKIMEDLHLYDDADQYEKHNPTLGNAVGTIYKHYVNKDGKEVAADVSRLPEENERYKRYKKAVETRDNITPRLEEAIKESEDRAATAAYLGGDKYTNINEYYQLQKAATNPEYGVYPLILDDTQRSKIEASIGNIIKTASSNGTDVLFTVDSSGQLQKVKKKNAQDIVENLDKVVYGIDNKGYITISTGDTQYVLNDPSLALKNSRQKLEHNLTYLNDYTEEGIGTPEDRAFYNGDALQLIAGIQNGLVSPYILKGLNPIEMRDSRGRLEGYAVIFDTPDGDTFKLLLDPTYAINGYTSKKNKLDINQKDTYLGEFLNNWAADNIEDLFGFTAQKVE